MTTTQSLSVSYPALASEWSKKNLLSPDKIKPKSNKKVWWTCPKNHEYEAYVYHRTGNGSGCPFCSGRLPIKGENDLATLRPDLVPFWSKENSLLPEEVTAQSGRKVLWHCVKGHTRTAAVYSVVAGKGCGFCSGLRPIPGETDFKTKQPEMAPFWRDSRDLATVSEFSHYKATWACEFGHEFEMQVSKVSMGQWCPNCVDLRNPAIVSKLAELLEGKTNVRLDEVKWSNGVRFEVDIIKDDLVVEYDGGFWHKYSSDKDTYKTQKLLDAGYKVVRVRETILEPLDIIHENLIQVSFRYNLKKLDLLGEQIGTWNDQVQKG